MMFLGHALQTRKRRLPLGCRRGGYSGPSGTPTMAVYSHAAGGTTDVHIEFFVGEVGYFVLGVPGIAETGVCVHPGSGGQATTAQNSATTAANSLAPLSSPWRVSGAGCVCGG